MDRVANIMFWRSFEHTVTNLYSASAGTNNDGTRIVYPPGFRGLCYPVRLWGEREVAAALKAKIEANAEVAKTRDRERTAAPSAAAS